MKPSGIGGMAVMEGVMMKNKEEYAVAVRKPNNEIEVEKSTHKDFADKVKLFKLPIFRGMLAFVDSLVVGVKVLNYSASFFEEEEEPQTKKKKEKANKKAEINSADDDTDFEIEEVSVPDSAIKTEKKENKVKNDSKDDRSNALLMALAVLLSIVISVALFMVLPVVLTNFLSGFVKNKIVMNLIEGLIRLAIFIGYVILAAKMPEIKRVFMYHGAEHKTINCLEHGCELTVENVRRHSKQHKRCGTSFMLLVIIISLIVFLFIPTGNLAWRVLSRILLVPFIAGISYEFIRLAGKTENKVVDVLSQPGLWMQGLTTKEPDDSMIEVAIASVDAVFDWRTFLADEKGENKSKSSQAGKKTEQVKSNKSSKQSNTSKQINTQNRSESQKQSGNQKQGQTKNQAGEQKQSSTQKQESTETAAKQGDSTKQESAAKQESSSKQESAAKQGGSSKQETISKQGNSTKQSNTLKQTNTSKNENQNIASREKIAPVHGKSTKEEEEDDEILKALDKYFDDRTIESKKAADGK